MLLTCLAGAVAVGSAAPQDQTGAAEFGIFLRGQRIGTERVTVERATDGWTITAAGSTGGGGGMAFDTFIAKYGPDWQTRSLEVRGTARGQALSLTTRFADGNAVSDVVQGGQQTQVTHKVSDTTVILPNNFFAAYEALALRLNQAAAGNSIPVYVAPEAELAARIERVSPRRLESPGTTIELRQFDLVFPNPSGPLNVEVWVDARGRLARVAIPIASVTVIRDDLTSVMTRVETFNHPRDEDVFIPANGFNLGATITPPAGVDKPPVVILLAGSGAQDRNETVFGIPILGQVAARLSDAGFFVVRYDKRGVGQSGGRVESSSLEAYSEDARAVIQWIRRRRDVDRDRLALVGHSEGGAVALLTAGRNRGDVDAIGLIAAPGKTGRQITLDQQRHALDLANESDVSKQEKIALQTRLMEAVISGRGWEAIPPELRKQADTQWFRSWLTYDPAEAVRRTNQPIFIAQGDRDTQIPVEHAGTLEALANDRRVTRPATQKVVVPGINHLLVPAVSGEVAEYATLPDKAVSPALTDALIDWLREALRVG